MITPPFIFVRPSDMSQEQYASYLYTSMYMANVILRLRYNNEQLLKFVLNIINLEDLNEKTY